jgi:hypothetical protein
MNPTIFAPSPRFETKSAHTWLFFRNFRKNQDILGCTQTWYGKLLVQYTTVARICIWTAHHGAFIASTGRFAMGNWTNLDGSSTPATPRSSQQPQRPKLVMRYCSQQTGQLFPINCARLCDGKRHSMSDEYGWKAIHCCTVLSWCDLLHRILRLVSSAVTACGPWAMQEFGLRHVRVFFFCRMGMV